MRQTVSLKIPWCGKMNVIGRPAVQLVRLGRMKYEPALKLQQSLVKRIQAGEDANFLLLVEHYPGKARSLNQIKLLWSQCKGGTSQFRQAVPKAFSESCLDNPQERD